MLISLVKQPKFCYAMNQDGMEFTISSDNDDWAVPKNTDRFAE